MRILEPPRFLIDENLSPDIASGVRQRNAVVDIISIGGPGAPGKNTLDAEILRFCEAQHRILVTNNRKSMPSHLATFAAEGRHHWGNFEVRDLATLGDPIEEVVLIWGATDASEHVDKVRWIPE